MSAVDVTAYTPNGEESKDNAHRVPMDVRARPLREVHRRNLRCLSQKVYLVR